LHKQRLQAQVVADLRHVEKELRLHVLGHTRIAGLRRPRWTAENRPLIDTSKPAIPGG
jgi:hypothetical protein